MNEFEIVNEYGYSYDSVLNKVLNETLKEENVDNALFTIILTDEETVHKLNKEYRGIDRTTDVLSFAYEDNDEDTFYDKRLLGEIFVCIPKVIEQAKEYGHSETRELAFLCVHGLLHLLGYDHMEKADEEKMFGRQEDILSKFPETQRK